MNHFWKTCKHMLEGYNSKKKMEEILNLSKLDS